MNAKILILLFLVLSFQGYAQNDTILITKIDTSFYKQLPKTKPIKKACKHSVNHLIPKTDELFKKKETGKSNPTLPLNFNINNFKQNYGVIYERFGFITCMGN